MRPAVIGHGGIKAGKYTHYFPIYQGKALFSTFFSFAFFRFPDPLQPAVGGWRSRFCLISAPVAGPFGPQFRGSGFVCNLPPSGLRPRYSPRSEVGGPDSASSLHRLQVHYVPLPGVQHPYSASSFSATARSRLAFRVLAFGPSFCHRTVAVTSSVQVPAPSAPPLSKAPGPSYLRFTTPFSASPRNTNHVSSLRQLTRIRTEFPLPSRGSALPLGWGTQRPCPSQAALTGPGREIRNQMPNPSIRPTCREVTACGGTFPDTVTYLRGFDTLISFSSF